MVPIGLALLLLSGIGPLVAWRRVQWQSLRRNFQGPLLVAAVTAAVLVAVGVRHGAGTTAFAFCAFVATTLWQEFYRGTRARQRSSHLGVASAFVDLFRRNRRRYGGYVVHAGLVLVFVGIAASSAFQIHNEQVLKTGDSFDIQDYHMTFRGTQSYSLDRRNIVEATLSVTGPGGETRELHPRKDHFTDSDQYLSAIALWPTPRQDLYVVVQSVDKEGRALIRAWVNPLVCWIWLGGAVMVLGGFICLAPDSAVRVARLVPVGAKAA
jgi:cytochrome c-type biogenesis protein CcmF